LNRARFVYEVMSRLAVNLSARESGRLMLVFIVDKVIFDLINNRKIKPEDFTQWTYSSAINMLKQVGMVFKEKRVWRLNSLWLVELMKEWNDRLGVEYW